MSTQLPKDFVDEINRRLGHNEWVVQALTRDSAALAALLGNIAGVRPEPARTIRLFEEGRHEVLLKEATDAVAAQELLEKLRAIKMIQAVHETRRMLAEEAATHEAGMAS
jgi:hypothetical protein